MCIDAFTNTEKLCYMQLSVAYINVGKNESLQKYANI